MVEPSRGDKWRKFIPGTYQQIYDNLEDESDPDIVIAPQLVVEDENHNKDRTYLLQPRSMISLRIRMMRSHEVKYDDEESDEEGVDYDEC